MYPRTNYEMTEEDKQTLLSAMQPERAMLIGGTTGQSLQERANDAWARLGEKMGFDSMTVQPSSRGDRFFTAVPNETETQKADRLAREAVEKKKALVKKLEEEISALNAKLTEILAS